MTTRPVRDARRVTFAELIDFAGLFPPASLTMEAAVAEYRRVLSVADGWIVGRFLCPSSRLTELAATLTRTMEPGDPPWQVAAVFDEALGPAAANAATFHQYSDPAAAIVATETRLTGVPDPSSTVGVAGVGATALAASSPAPGVTVFLEVDVSERWETEIPAAIVAIAEARGSLRLPIGAKLRCGGADEIPSPEQVAMFVIACEQRGVPFKATAGLHHAVRGTTEGTTHHGFVNLLVASALAASTASFHDVAAVVGEEDGTAFSIGLGSLRHRQRSFSTAALHAVRAVGFTAFGSCDAVTPAADLRRMGLLL